MRGQTLADESLQGAEAAPQHTRQDTRSLGWYEANQRYLAAALTALHARLTAVLQKRASGQLLEEYAGEDVPALDPAAWSFSQPPALEQLCSSFELSSFERGMVLLAAGAEMDSRLAELYASLDASRRPLPTLSLALTCLPEAHWAALSPSRALRHWQLIELVAADTLVSSPFRISERILHYLAGLSGLDERLQPMVRAVNSSEAAPPSFAKIAEQVAVVWTDAAQRRAASDGPAPLPVINLCGADPDANLAIAGHAAGLLNLRLYAMSLRTLPPSSADAEMVRLWEREAILSGTALLVETEDTVHAEQASSSPAHLLESIGSPIILSSRHPYPAAHRARAVFYTGRPTRAEQAEIWKSALADAAGNGTIEAVTAQFNLPPTAIRSAAHRAAAVLQSNGEESAALWDACRIEARPRLEGLAQRVDSAATWDDLVLPAKEREQLRQLAVHVRQRTRVYEQWGFGGRSGRGLGMSALFAGPSGTGKTTAAEAIANELRLDLFRIDLSQVVSKYIGETEKNLGRLFDAAEQGAAVLLFDEADALFGKRTEVKDSHDRYANVEVSYLLQRMEAYRGLAILTTNRKSSLDSAFLRRIRFAVEFPFPEASQRAEIWRRIFPAKTPLGALDFERLARLRISGGNIQNIAMGAAFLAADANQPVGMEHLLAAARTEFAKLETPLGDAEVAGWL